MPNVAKVASIINYKGGVGKTTLAVNIGAVLAQSGKRVLLVDFDPQCSLTFSLNKSDDYLKIGESGKHIKSWFSSIFEDCEDPIDNYITRPRFGGLRNGLGRLELIASDLSLIDVDSDLSAELSSGTSEAKKSALFLKTYSKFKKALTKIEQRYDYIIIDCPPSFGPVVKNAIVASDFVIVPTRPERLSTIGIDHLIQSVSVLKTEYNAKIDGMTKNRSFSRISPEIAGIVFTMVKEYGGKPIKAHRAIIASVRKGEYPVLDDYVLHGTAFGKDFGSTPLGVRRVVDTTEVKVQETIKRVVYELESRMS